MAGSGTGTTVRAGDQEMSFVRFLAYRRSDNRSCTHSAKAGAEQSPALSVKVAAE
jgi:hypothetical protein